MPTTPNKLSETIKHQADAAIADGEAILDRAQKQKRPLTRRELTVLELVEETEIPHLHEKWCRARRAEGHTVRGRLPDPGAVRTGIRVSNQEDENTIWLYGDIGEKFGGVSADEFRLKLETVPESEPVTVHIYSAGGDFFTGLAIHHLLKGRSGAVHVVVDALAASAASIIAMAGETITMAKGSWLMIHEAHVSFAGEVDDLRHAVEVLEKTNEQIADVYAARWRGTREELAEAIRQETWFSDEQAVKVGLADYIAGELAVAAHFDPGKYGAKIPKVLRIAASGAERTRIFQRRSKLRLLEMAFEF